MKLTNEEKQLFSEIKQKHNLAESWLMNIFKKRLKNGLINDPSIKQALTKASTSKFRIHPQCQPA